MADRNIQKILIKPPLSGLNIHDNPLDLSFMFATELVNFLPPTTKLEVRPGVENVMILDGITLGMYSYTVGARKTYRSGGLLITMPSLSTPAYSSLIVKCAMANGKTGIYSINPMSKEKVLLDGFQCNEYSSDYCMINNSMFFTDGSNTSAPYIYSGTKGISRMAWKSPDNNDIYKNETNIPSGMDLTDLDNMTAYNGYIFSNSVGTFTVYYMQGVTADPEAPSQKAWYNRIFKPKATGWFTINGFAKLGGSIMKMFTLGTNQKDTIGAYLCVCTDQGELLLYQGTSPESLDSWKLQGVFRIPIPLNKRCFAQVEGDIVVATQMGLMSIQRVVFGNKTQITEALEWRISDLFSRYEFRMNGYKNHFFMKYHARTRQLILNVPEFVPTRLYDIVRGYVFNKDRSLKFDSEIFTDQNTIDTFFGFINDYLVTRQVNYSISYVFNNDEDLGIKLSFEFFDFEVNEEGNGASVKLRILFYVTTESETKHFIGTDELDPETGEAIFIPGWEYLIKNAYEVIEKDNIVPIRCSYDWNLERRIIDIDGIRVPYYTYDFDKEYEVTDIRPKTEQLTVEFGNYDLPTFVLYPSATPTPYNDLLDFNTHFFTKMSYPYINPTILYLGNIPFGGRSVMPSFAEYAREVFAYKENTTALDKKRFPINLTALATSIVQDQPIAAQPLSSYKNQTRAFVWVYRDIIEFRKINSTDIDNLKLVTEYKITFTTYNIETEKGSADLMPTWTVTGHLETFTTLQDTFDVISQKNVIFGAYLDGRLQTWCEMNDAHPDKIYMKIFPVWNVTVNTPGDGVASIQEIGRRTMYRGSTLYKELGTEEQAFVVTGSDNLEYLFINGASGFRLWDYNENNIRLFTVRMKQEVDRITGKSGGIYRDDETVSQPMSHFVWDQFFGLNESYLMVATQHSGNTFKEATNFDYSVVPFIAYTSVVGQYESSQYVFDTHYGTWAQWKDINMIDAVEHDGDFYFVRTEPKVLETLNVNTRTMLCRFNPDFNGDFQDDITEGVPIVARYQAGHTDIAIGHSRKQFKRVKILGTEPVFWGSPTSGVIPFTFKYETDFEPSGDIIYPYSDYDFVDPYKPENGTVHPVLRAFREKYNITKALKDFTYMEKKKFLELYAIMANKVKSIELPLTAGPCDRISMGCELQVVEHNLIIYGYELFYEVVNP